MRALIVLYPLCEKIFEVRSLRQVWCESLPGCLLLFSENLHGLQTDDQRRRRTG